MVAIQIKIKGSNLKDQVAYLISNQHTRKGLNLNIHVLGGFYNIKRKSTLYIMIANKHVTFNKGQYIGPMEPHIDKIFQTSVNSVIAQKMMDDQVQLNTFTPPSHHLSSEVKQSLNELLKSFKSQFVKDETSIGMTNLTKM